MLIIFQSTNPLLFRLDVLYVLSIKIYVKIIVKNDVMKYKSTMNKIKKH